MPSKRELLETRHLMTFPIKDKNRQIPRTQVDVSGVYFQADLLYLPPTKVGTDESGKDVSAKYLLVVVDLGSRQFDAEPLTERTSSATLKAFLRMTSRDIISFVTMQEVGVDPGSEFMKDFLNVLTTNGIKVKVGKTGRHRNQSVVEKANSRLSRHLYTELHARENISKQYSYDWLGKNNSKLRKAIKFLNNEHTYKSPSFKSIKNKKTIMPDKKARFKNNILFKGDPVHIILEQPRNIYGKVEKDAKFRSTDLRFERAPTKVKSVVLKKGFPFMYSVEDDGVKNRDIFYTRSQLLEPLPPEKVRRTGRQRKKKTIQK